MDGIAPLRPSKTPGKASRSGPIELIEWLDPSGNSSEWEDWDFVDRCVPTRFKVVGMVVKDDHEGVTVVSIWAENDDTISGVLSIPGGVILKRTVLGVSEHG